MLGRGIQVKEVLKVLSQAPSKTGDKPKRILICAADTTTCVQLAKVLRYGHEHVLALQLARYYRFKSGEPAVTASTNASTATATTTASSAAGGASGAATATSVVGGGSARAAKRRRMQRRGGWGQNGNTSQGGTSSVNGAGSTTQNVSINTRHQRAYETIARSYVTVEASPKPTVPSATSTSTAVTGAAPAAGHATATETTGNTGSDSIAEDEDARLLQESFAVGDVGDVLLFALRNEGGTRQTGANTPVYYRVCGLGTFKIRHFIVSIFMMFYMFS